MFCLSVVDHIRLDFGHVAQNYTVHADAAERLAGYHPQGPDRRSWLSWR